MNHREIFTLYFCEFYLLKNTENIREAIVKANKNKDNSGCPANPPFKPGQFVERFSNRSGPKGNHDSE
jgi:hypothetical protein